jgi:hypothetical protein
VTNNHWYSAAESPELVAFDTVRGLGIVGQGEPGGASYGQCLAALYTTAGT